jgi:hypothetical protein
MHGRIGGMKQFSIRDLLFLVVVVALALGWWLDRRPTTGRFQGFGGGNNAYVVDTATGKVWNQAESAFLEVKTR